MKNIRTARLILRPLSPDDLADLHALYAQGDLMRYITGRPRTLDESRKRLEKDLGHHREFGFGLCLVELAATGEIIGRAGLEPRPTERGLQGELAWMITAPHQGRGYATEAGRALVEVGRRLGLARVFAVTHPDNAPSIRVMEKVGLSLVGRRAEELEFEG